MVSSIALQTLVVSIVLYRCTTWTVTKRMEKKLDGNYTRMMRAILNKAWGQHPTKQQLYGHLPLITKTIKVRRTRHAGHCWRSRDELINNVLQWTPSYGRAKAERLARTYIPQLCEDTVCSPEDLPEAINDREEWWERISGISVLVERQDDDDLFASRLNGLKYCYLTLTGQFSISHLFAHSFKYKICKRKVCW